MIVSQPAWFEVLFLPASASSSGEDCAYLQIARDAQGGNSGQGCFGKN